MNEFHEYMDCEHLHLLKDENNEVSVNKIHNLKQHQIDGLRFLFKQFKKKKTGVIINFPPACGKSVTVLLFLNAIRNLLKLPILILTKDENEIEEWEENFANWTEFSEDDIAIESRNPLIKKKIFIKNLPVKLSSYLSRSWSIIIVKEDLVNKEINKLVFSADFKIWITSTDVTKQLPFLSFIYTWLNPKTKMNVNDFVAKDNRPTEKYEKSVLLETFLEDVVIQRNVNMQPFQTKEKTVTPEVAVESNESKRPKRSIKNKDATGTKIKRSKTRIEDKNTVDASNQLLIHNQTINVSNNYDKESDNDFTISNHERKENEKNKLKLSEDDTNDYDSPKLDVESFIRDQQPLQATSLQQRDLDLLFSMNKKDESNTETEFTDTLQVTTTAIEPLRDENIASQDNSTESLNFDDDNKIGEMNIVLGNDDKSLVNQNDVKIVNATNTSNDAKSAQTNEIISIAKDNSIGPLNFYDNFEVKINENVFNINQNDMNGDGKIINDKAQISTFCTLKKYNEVSEELDTVTKVDVEIDSTKTRESDKSHKDIDCKISELEERTLKKFKGSVLDSIF